MIFCIFTVPFITRTDFFNPNGLGVLLVRDQNDFVDRTLAITHFSFTHLQIGGDMGAYYILGAFYTVIKDWNILPFVSSLILLTTVYLFGVRIGNNRLSSLIATSFLAITHTFYWYSISVTYPNFDALLCLLALYPFAKHGVIKKPILWFFSVIMKGISFTMLPTLMIINKDKKTRIILGVITAVMVTVMITINHMSLPQLQEINWLGNLAFLTGDFWILPVIPMICIGLWMSKHEFSKPLLIMMCNAIAGQFATMFVYTTMQPYRFTLTMCLIAISFNIFLPKLFMRYKTKKLQKEESKAKESTS